jgi:hypothetical protein
MIALLPKNYKCVVVRGGSWEHCFWHRLEVRIACPVMVYIRLMNWRMLMHDNVNTKQVSHPSE